MNLHGIASPLIAVVNPMQVASVRKSTGYTTDATGQRIPSYAPATPISCQIQSLSFNELTALDGLNIQGVKRKIYINGAWDGVIRADGKGGDLVTMPNGDIFLVVLALETWPDWSCVAVVKQNGS
jgi:hypothetical protein